MSLQATSQRAFSMIRRLRPNVATASVTSPNMTFPLFPNNPNDNNVISPPNRRYLSSKPTVDIAKTMPVSMSEMNNETLVTIAALGNHEARCEALVRHIMSVDGVDYDAGKTKFDEIAKANRTAISSLAVYPYFVGIGVGMIAAFGSLPLVFELNTAKWFNEVLVTTDVPEPKDLETVLEVGSWTWNWMEPPLGALSFSLLCLQYARAQLTNLGLHPYTSLVISRRADALAAAYPQYDPTMIRQFSESDPLA